MGLIMGNLSIDKRGRIIIPKEIREKLGLSPNQALIIEIKNKELIIKPAARSDEFKAELKGCIHGSKIPVSELKEIWGINHAHH